MKIYVAKVFITDTEKFTPPTPWDHEFSIVVSSDGKFVKYVYPPQIAEAMSKRVPSNDKIKKYTADSNLKSGEKTLLLALDLYSRAPLFTKTEIVEGKTFKDVLADEQRAVKVAYAKRTHDVDTLDELGEIDYGF